MSFLDLDEWLIDLAGRVELVYSPLIDIKSYPDNVDIALIEGAVANEEHLELARRIRRSTKILVSFGDCARTGNVTAMRNFLGSATPVLQRAYEAAADLQARVPHAPGLVPVLLDRVLPLHEVVDVEVYLPGCPPTAPVIRAALEALLKGTPAPAAR
jgi:NAD-reducing hydrogenase small subunit